MSNSICKFSRYPCPKSSVLLFALVFMFGTALVLPKWGEDTKVLKLSGSLD
jgi:hypothetical protein